jgi:hypothetical protein
MEAWLARHSMCILIRGYFWVVIVERMVARIVSTTSRANFAVSANRATVLIAMSLTNRVCQRKY